MSNKILITGNMGYIGPVLIEHLRKTLPAGTHLVGHDAGYFGHCLTACDGSPERWLDEQMFGDIRTIPAEAFAGVDAVVQLAAISNDPMGKEFEQVTDEINAEACISAARKAKEAGASHFVFASSCSMYGEASGEPKKETDSLNPLTAYARSKVKAEVELGKLADENFTVTALRFGTACGMSPRLRLDLVVNDFVACAVLHKKIEVLSDGSPWRPLIHVKDMSRAMEWAISRKSDAGNRFLAVNVGSQAWTWQIGDLAQSVAKVIGGIEVSINTDAAPDKRSYRVDFSLYEAMAPNHQPQTDFTEAIEDLRRGVERMHFDDGNFRESNYIRLKMLKDHLVSGRLNKDLYPNAPV